MSEIRDSNGKFKAGNPGGPGRPKLADDLPVIEGIKQAGSAEKVAAMLDRLYAAALRGNVRAAELWLAYIAGRPQEKIKLTTDSDVVRVTLHWGGQSADDNPALDTTAQPVIESGES
ncbi:MAG: hypothetical protein ABI947_01030 [Chloroflexota bacterium]